MYRKCVILVFAFYVICFGRAGVAGTWNYNNDFSIANGNPNGVWSYGNFELSSGNFRPYTVAVSHTASPPNDRWENSNYSSGTGPDNEGCVSKNVSGTRQDWYSWSPGQSWTADMTGMMSPIALRTIGTGARFTAPENGQYHAEIIFENRVLGTSTGGTYRGLPTELWVKIDGTNAYAGVVSGFEDNPANNFRTYSATNLPLSAGDTIDFFVSSDQNTSEPYSGGDHLVGVECYISNSSGLPEAAGNPIPAPDSTFINLDTALEWDRSVFTASYDVYLGTGYSAVAGAGTGSDEFMGNFPTTGSRQSYTPEIVLHEDTTYYWRIDTKNSLGTHKGVVWQFTTMEGYEEPDLALEQDTAAAWISDKFTGPNPNPPFTFVYGGTSSASLLPGWGFTRTSEVLDENRIKWTLQYSQPSGPLVVRCDVIVYNDYPAVEWVLNFKNNGSVNSSVLSSVNALAMNEDCPAPDAQMGIPGTYYADADVNWGTNPPNPNGNWTYYGNWVASWAKLNVFDKTAYPGLERWSRSGNAPWVGVNRSSNPITVDGSAVQPGQLVMLPGATMNDSPALAWTCPKTSIYNINISIKNIGSGSAGTNWNVHNFGWDILDSGSIANQGQDSFVQTSQLVPAGETYCLTFMGDLTLVNFTVTEVYTPWDGDFRIFHAVGSGPDVSDFEPVVWGVGPGTSLRFLPSQGRSSDGITLPFFNIERPDGTGNIVGIGWTGQWFTSFTRNVGSTLSVQAGMDNTNIRLYPGEQIRTPSILLTFWNGSRIHSQNAFRRLLRDHYSPTPGGEKVVPPVACAQNTGSDPAIQYINDIGSHHLPVDTFWIDAGWYICKDGSWVNTGTWEPNPAIFPNGLEPVAQATHNNGFKFLLWFEPERVTPDSWLAVNHQEWLLGSSAGWQLLDFGNPAALAWAKSKFSGMIQDIGIDIYRQDFNHYPLQYWTDTSSRKGIKQIRYITGMYEFLDYLLEQSPNLLIDNCASGGKRIDLEMLKRSLVLWRSDECWDPEIEQCFTYGLSSWIPYTGRGSITTDKYIFRSGMGSHFSLAHGNTNMPWSAATTRLNELNSIKHLYSSDFYPLTAYSRSDNVWMAWQYDSPELSEGLVQAFRRSGCSAATMTFQLKELVPTAQYRVINLDTGGNIFRFGYELMETGLQVTITDLPGSALFTYRITSPLSDYNMDRQINLEDFSFLANQWLNGICGSPSFCGRTDLDFNGVVDIVDFSIFLQAWMTDW